MEKGTSEGGTRGWRGIMDHALSSVACSRIAVSAASTSAVLIIATGGTPAARPAAPGPAAVPAAAEGMTTMGPPFRARFTGSAVSDWTTAPRLSTVRVTTTGVGSWFSRARPRACSSAQRASTPTAEEAAKRAPR